MTDPEAVVITIVPASGNWAAPPVKRLARLLKAMRRSYGWRCVSIKVLEPEKKQP